MVLVGANDVGKTSLLRALNLTLGPMALLYQNVTLGDLRDPEGAFEVSVTFQDFDTDDRALFYREISVASANGEETLEVRLQATRDPDDPDSVLIQRWCPGRGDVRSISREQIARLGWRYLPALRQSSASHFDGPGGAIQMLLQAVERDLGSERQDLANFLEGFNTNLAASPALEALREEMAKHLSSSMPRTIESDELAIRTAADPDTSVLTNVSMYMARDGGYVPLSEQSDGIRQLISMTLFDLAEGTANVIAIDEPELHLHPASQRTVAELLTKETNQKLLVTHSPYVVQKFDPTQVVTVHEGGVVRQLPQRHLSSDERHQAHWWSPRMLEALTAKFAILVEGIADRVIVEAAAQAKGISLDRIGAVVFELGGAENFPAVYKLLGPAGFNVGVLGLVDEAEQAKWVGAVGGRPKNVVNKVVFISCADLEEEYCRAIGSETVAVRLINSRVAHDATAILNSCQAADLTSVEPVALATFCKKKVPGGPSRKLASALAVAKGLTSDEATRMTSIGALLAELEARVVP